jgi:hypothetical protein
VAIACQKSDGLIRLKDLTNKKLDYHFLTMKTEPDYDVVDEEQDEPLFYDLTTERNEDAWLDAAYEDRFDTGYEPDWEY